MGEVVKQKVCAQWRFVHVWQYMWPISADCLIVWSICKNIYFQIIRTRDLDDFSKPSRFQGQPGKYEKEVCHSPLYGILSYFCVSRFSLRTTSKSLFKLYFHDLVCIYSECVQFLTFVCICHLFLVFFCLILLCVTTGRELESSQQSVDKVRVEP